MKDIAAEKYGRALITDYIFDETVTGIFVRSKNLKLAVGYGNELLASVELLYVDEHTFHQAWKIFSEQMNKELSFTDSITLATMKTHGIPRIGTFDEDFQDLKDIEAIT